MITNPQSGTRIDEIADGIYRISTPLDIIPGGFSFNQYLIKDESPLLFHTGPRQMFALVSEAVAKVVPVERLRYIAASHFEADECGSMNSWLAAAPAAEPLCGQVAKLVSMDDFADRPAHALADGETLSLGRHAVTWFDTPHVPHSWECGLAFEATTRTFLCGDLFTQPGGSGIPPLTEGDVLGPSEAFRLGMDYFSHTKNARPILEKLAATRPAVLACMHGSAWSGDGAKLLLALAKELAKDS